MASTLQLLIRKCSMFIDSSNLAREGRLNLSSEVIISTIWNFISRGKREKLAIFLDDIDYQNDPISILKSIPSVFDKATRIKPNFTKGKMLLLSEN